MGVSGFLVSSSKLSKSLRDLATSMKDRLVVPWLIASALFFVVVSTAAYAQGETIDAHYILDALFKPYYHLWYVPAYITYFFVLKLLCCEARIDIAVLLVSSGIIALVSYGIYNASIADEGIIGVFFYNLRPQFFFYFALGYALRSNLQKKVIPVSNLTLSGFVAICAVGYISLFKSGTSDFTRGVIALLENGALITLLMRLSVRGLLPASRLFERIGENSLFIYLYHVPIVWVLKMVPGYGTLPVYFIGFLIWLGITVSVNKYLPKGKAQKLLSKWSGWIPERLPLCVR